MLLKTKKGIYLLEVTIAIIILSIVLSMIITTLSYVTNNISRTTTNNEGYSNGKLSIEFITSEIERASYIDVYLYDDNTLEKIIIFEDQEKIFIDASVISFVGSGNAIKSNTLQFGGVSNQGGVYTNRFSNYIEDIKIIYENNILSIHLITMDKINNNDVKQQYFNSKINTSNKNIIFYKKSVDTN